VTGKTGESAYGDSPVPRRKRALITGITGQDGSYLAELLLAKGYEVHGIVRRVAIEDPERRLWRLSGFRHRLHLHAASLESFASLQRVIGELQPHECYHLAAQSFVAYSFEDEFSTLNTNINGTHYVLSAIKDCAPDCRFYFAGSSEMFGKVAESPQTERTAFHPRSAYAISKVAGFDLTRNYRETYGLKAWSGILYHHESPRRGYEYVTRKISSHVARIKLGLARELKLGNLQARRDWGHAKDYVQAMWLMLQQEVPDDYIIATGETHSVHEFVEAAFAYAGMDYQEYVKIDPRLHRPAQDELLGDPSRAKRALDWSCKTKFSDLVAEMVEADLQMLSPSSRVRFPRLRTVAGDQGRKVVPRIAKAAQNDAEKKPRA
jgi:GDPmannose 4,6-dehydratase